MSTYIDTSTSRKRKRCDMSPDPSPPPTTSTSTSTPILITTSTSAPSGSAATSTSTSTSTSSAPSNLSLPVVEITSSSPFRQTSHALLNIHLPNVLSNIIIELLEDQWNGWEPIHGVSCDLFHYFSSTSSFEHAISHHGQHYDISLDDDSVHLIDHDVSHIRYHLLRSGSSIRKYGLITDHRPDLCTWGFLDGNITWKHLHQPTHVHAAVSTPTPTSTRATTSHQRYPQLKQQQQQQQQQEKYEMQRDPIMNKMSDVERSIVYRLFTSSPYSWSHFRHSLPTTSTLAHILSRPWSAWRSVRVLVPACHCSRSLGSHRHVFCHLQLVSPDEWIEIFPLHDSPSQTIRLRYQYETQSASSSSLHPIPECMMNLMERLQLSVQLGRVHS